MSESSCVSINNQRTPDRHSICTCPQRPVVTLQVPRFSEFFMFARSLVCPRSPASSSSLVLLVNTVVPLLLATQKNHQPCGRLHMFAMGVLHTTAQTMKRLAHLGALMATRLRVRAMIHSASFAGLLRAEPLMRRLERLVKEPPQPSCCTWTQE